MAQLRNSEYIMVIWADIMGSSAQSGLMFPPRQETSQYSFISDPSELNRKESKDEL